jgi:hypothetical protein
MQEILDAIHANTMTYTEVRLLLIQNKVTNVNGIPLWYYALQKGNVYFFVGLLARFCLELSEDVYEDAFYSPARTIRQGYPLVTETGVTLEDLVKKCYGDVKDEEFKQDLYGIITGKYPRDFYARGSVDEQSIVDLSTLTYV